MPYAMVDTPICYIFDDAMDREEDSELDTYYVVHRSDLPDLSFEVDPDSDDNLSVHLEDHSLGQDYDSSSEVASAK
jgi:hypothetical protein